MSIFRQKGKQNNAKIFFKDFNPANGNSYFVGIGNAVTNSSDLPVKTADSVQSDYTTWDNLFLLSQITPDDVSLMIKKYAWTPGTRYEAFNKDTNQITTGEKYYVFNETNNRVYLCMSAPPNANETSIQAPVGNFVDLEIKSDGYAWKFLYQITDEKLEKFNYPGYIPIEQIGLDLLTDERILQQQVSIASIKGSLESITVLTQGNPFSTAVNINFSKLEYLINSRTIDQNNEVTVTINPVGKLELVTTIGFYNDNYVITFLNGFTATIKTSSIDPQTGNLVFNLCEVYSPNQETLPPQNTPFSILPKIKVIGNGSGAVAIPKLNQNTRFIENIVVLNGGSNYSYIETELLVNTGAKIKPILGLNGIGSDLIEFFNPNHVLISKKIAPVLSSTVLDPVLYTAPQNTGVVYMGSQYTNIISANTFYTQVSLIKNPKLISDQVAGIVYNEEREMVLEAIDPKIIILIGSQENPYTNPNNFFEVGDMVVRGPSNTLDQFRAIVKNISISDNITTLTCDLLNGALETYAGYTLRNFKLLSNSTDNTDENTDSGGEYATQSIPLIFEDCDNNCSQNIGHYYENAFRGTAFANDDVVLGSVSLSGGEIVKLQPGFTYVNPLYPTRVKIVVKNSDRTFLTARYENGIYVPGEIVTSFKITGGTPEPQTRGRLVSISEPITRFEPATYGCAYILKCRINRGPGSINTPNEIVNTDGVNLETNTIIRQGLTGSVGKIIRTGIPVDESDVVYLYVNNYNLPFTGSTDSTEQIYIIDDLYEPTTYQETKLFVEDVVYEPSVMRYSGNLLYINDAGPIQRKIDNSETLKLLVEF